MKYHFLYYLLFVIPFVLACDQSATPTETTTVVQDSPTTRAEWAKDMNIYEVNIRQYTPQGTLNAFAQHLGRLDTMGVDILWLMPIYPISTTKRKGSLGSYYAVTDYRAVNPKFGTLEDVKNLVQQAHERDMKVILDWVPNHTGFDHVWTKQHPDWYMRDPQTDTIMHPKDTDWTDVADLNYDKPEMRQAMIDAMKYWIEEADIDGFRCDVAFFVPDDFWAEAVPELRQQKDVFMLAESEHASHRNLEYFNATYGWSFHHLMNDVAQGKKNADSLRLWLAEDRKVFKKGYHMHFLTNHDENSWNGTIDERMGDAADAMAVLAFTFDGMPLIYSGQEAGLNKRLKFFEKDQIDWGKYSKATFYKTLLELKHRNQALWNGDAGGEPRLISNTNEKNIFAYVREKNGDKIVVILNLSGQQQEVKLLAGNYAGEYNNVFGNSTVPLTENMVMQLNPWDYMVLSNK